MSGNENELVIANSGRRPLQIVVQVGWFVVFVNAEKRDVEIVARIFEIVRIPAEKGDVELGRKDKAHIRVLLVLVKVVGLSRIKSDYVAAEASRSTAIFLNLRHRSALGLANLCRRHARLHTCIDLVRDVLNSNELVEFEVGTFRFLRLGFGVEAGLDVVMSFGRQLLYTGGTDVMICEGQSVSRHKRSRAAIVESDRRETQVIQPVLSQFETVLGFDLVFWRFIVEPHAFVGCGQVGEYEGTRKQDRAESFHYGWFLHEEAMMG